MATLLVFARDHSAAVPPLPVANLAQLPKRGDLVAWRPDGWGWGVRELADPAFRIFDWPGVDPAELDGFLGGLPAERDASMNPTTYPQYRASGFDFSTAPQVIQDFFNDDTRAAPTFAITSDAMSLLPLKVARPVISVSATTPPIKVKP